MEKVILKTLECSCYFCKSMCSRRPCWPTPSEAKILVKKGFLSKMMVDYWEAKQNVYILVPAAVHWQKKIFSPEFFLGFFPDFRCVMQNSKGKCIIHAYKPLEGRISGCDEALARAYGKNPTKAFLNAWSRSYNRWRTKEVVSEWAKPENASWLQKLVKREWGLDLDIVTRL